jgi:pimeloyl-ACP methyl ester carboxylesterase
VKPWIRKVRSFTITAIILGAAVILGCQALVRSSLFYPTHHSGDNGLTRWTHEGVLFGFARTVADPETVWLMLHGNAGQAADRVYALARFSERDAVFIMEYPGYGERPGSPSRKSFDKAALAAYENLRAQFPGKPVCVAGESIGSGPASTLARAAHPPDKLVLLTPFDEIKAVARGHVPWLPTGMMLAGSWNNVEALAGFKGPVEIFGAERDEVIPVVHARNLAASLPQAKIRIYPGGHNDWSQQPLVSIRNP